MKFNRRGHPTELTQDEWLTYFSKLKQLAQQNPTCRKRETEEFEQFISDLLMFIRQGESDYCFSIYHIQALLAEEPQRLVADYIEQDGIFEVRLED